ncbi:hypothetical protein PTKIN_Ptkin01aG0307100 [Pterospermum kingtungense]
MDNRVMVFDDDPKEFDSLSGSWTQSTPQFNVFKALETLPGLGLKLSESPSFEDKLDQLIQGQSSSYGDQEIYAYNTNYGYATEKATSKDNLQKMKAENFPISLLKIGSWQRVSRNEGDLVAKCYFAKRKLVWEFLENGLKSKIEIQWSDILSFKAVIQEDQPGVLDIELNQPPAFYREIDPQPRKHTQWRMASDFTGGQAPVIRRHHLEFPPGAIDRPLEKLLRCDSRLFQLSRQGYPRLDSPYFPSFHHIFGIGIDFGQGSHINFEQQPFSVSNVPPTHNLSFSNILPTYNSSQQPFQTFEETTQKSPNFKDFDSTISDQPTWGQGMISNNVQDSLITNQVGGMPLIDASISHQQAMTNQFGGLISPSPSSSQMHLTILSLQEAERNQRSAQILNDLQSMLSSHPPQTDQLFNGISENTNATNVTPSYGHNMINNVVGMNNLSNSSVIYPQAGSWAQIAHENMGMNMQPAGNNSFYSSSSSDPTMEYILSTHDLNPEVNDWSWKSG